LILFAGGVLHTKICTPHTSSNGSFDPGQEHAVFLQTVDDALRTVMLWILKHGLSRGKSDKLEPCFFLARRNDNVENVPVFLLTDLEKLVVSVSNVTMS
jgi:hypothetical protein